jgi:hypothetical protein
VTGLLTGWCVVVNMTSMFREYTNGFVNARPYLHEKSLSGYFRLGIPIHEIEAGRHHKNRHHHRERQPSYER